MRSGVRHIGNHGKTLLISGVLLGATLLPVSYARGASQFIRGDIDQSGQVGLPDAVQTLRYLFLNGEPPQCLDAIDANDDGFLDISDAVYTLLFLFDQGNPPPDPFPHSGYDLTPDAWGCDGQQDFTRVFILRQEHLNSGPYTITESGTPDEPLLYAMGENGIAQGSGIIIAPGVHDIVLYGNGKTLEYGRGGLRHLHGVDGRFVYNIKVEGMHLENRIARGTFKFGVIFNNYFGTIAIDRTTILTTSDDGDGIHLEGSTVPGNSQVIISNNEVTTYGSDADAIYLSGHLAGVPATGEIIDSNLVVTYGNSADGLHVNGGETVVGNSITTYGIEALGMDGGLGVVARDNTMTTYGSYSDVIDISSNNSIHNLRAKALGEHSNAVSIHGDISTGNVISDSSLEGFLNDIAVYSSGGSLRLTSVSVDMDRVFYAEPSSFQVERSWYADTWVGDHNHNPMPNVLVEGYRLSDDHQLRAPLFFGYTGNDGRLTRQILLGSTDTAQGGTYEAYQLSASYQDGNPVTQEYRYGPKGNVAGNIEARFILPVGAN